MKTFIRRMPAANTVAAGGTSTFQVPLGPTYRSLEIRYKAGAGPVNAPEATMAADITGVRVKINGISRIDLSGANLITILKYYGYTIDDGVLPLLFSRPYARTIAGEENSAIGTANLDTLTLEVDVAAGAVAPDLFLDAVYTPEKRDLGPMIQILTNSFSATLAGQYEISSLGRFNGHLVAIHMNSANLTAVQVQLDSVDYFDGDLETLASVLKRTGRVPQANWVHVEPTMLDRFDDVWPLENIQDFRQKLTMSAAGSVPILMETLNVPIRPARKAA